MDRLELGLYAPKPTQNIHCENSDASSRGDSGECFLCTGFAMREAVAADHDCYKTCNFRDRSGEKGLDCVEAGIER